MCVDTNEEPAETVEADYKACDPGNGTDVYMYTYTQTCIHIYGEHDYIKFRLGNGSKQTNA